MNSWPEANTRATKEETLSMRASARRTDSSSSTTAITGRSAIARFGDATGAGDSGLSSYTRSATGFESEAEDGAAPQSVVRPQSATLCLDDGAANCQSQAQALRLGGDEGLKDALQLFRRNAMATIRHRTLEHPV